jgi:hypothetical protein
MDELNKEPIHRSPPQPTTVTQGWSEPTLRSTSPGRIPEWRWEVAQVISRCLMRGRNCKKDQGIQTALQLQKMLKRWDYSDYRPPKMKKPLPEGVLEAYQLYVQSPYAQAELKARILAQEPFSIIAQKIHSTEAAIYWYELLFFNVLDRLQGESYISMQVIGLWRLRPSDPWFVPAFWMEMGYRRGPAYVDALVPLKNRIQEPLTPEDYLPSDDLEESLLRNVKILIETRLTLFDFTTVQPWLDLRAMSELTRREEEIEILIRQLHDAQALLTPLAGINLDYEMPELPWNAPTSLVTAQGDVLD